MPVVARIFCISFLLLLSRGAMAAEYKNDIRILIDVSGSMKRTDPSNLRVSAVKLLNGLIPEGSRAGIWTFGRYVDMTVKWGKVDAGWRRRADLGSEEIHSKGLFTNIEGALERASMGWDEPDALTRRSLIILTDGHVDISKNEAENARSRQTILDNSVVKLKNAGAVVQAVALSDDADEVLLKRLALETEGSFEVAITARDLHRIFFRMFERATRPDTISIEDNQFKVDSSIEEMTLLVFRKPGSQATKLFSPDGNRYTALQKGDANWRSDEAYDLITIGKPAEGMWSIEAAFDPDNRLMIVTDLSLGLAEQAVNVLPGDEVSIVAALYTKGRQISKDRFLRFVDFSIRHTDSQGVETEYELRQTEEPERKGQYFYKFSDGLEEGRHSIIVTADSSTFSRNKRMELNVQWPVAVAIKPSAQEAGRYTVSISPREEYIVPESLTARVNMESPDGKRQPLDLDYRDGAWLAPVETALDGIYKAHVSIDAMDQAGLPVAFDLGAFPMVGVAKTPQVTGVDTADEDAETAADSATPAETEESPRENEGTDWVMTSIIIVAANLVIILIGVGVFLALRRKSVPNELRLE